MPPTSQQLRLGQVDAELAGLSRRLGDVDRERARLLTRRFALLAERDRLLASLHASAVRASSLARQPEGANQAPTTAAKSAALTAVRTAGEVSPSSAQTALLTLGGILLAIAAVVFTVVAWAQFGLYGRAAILGGCTVLALGAPVVLHRRRLRSTAETIAALGLLLVGLDGYAAWTVGVGAVSGLPSATYAGAVLAVVAAAGLAYPLVVPLRIARPAGLAAAQVAAVLLLADPLGRRQVGWVMVELVLVAASLAVVVLAARRSDPPGRRPVAEMVVAAAGGGFALALAGPSLLLALATPAPDQRVYVAAGLTVVLAALLAGGAYALPRSWTPHPVRGIATGLVTALVAVAGLRTGVAALDLDATRTVQLALPATALALALVAVALRRVLDRPVGLGPFTVAAAVTAAAAVLPVLLALEALLWPLTAVAAPWHGVEPLPGPAGAEAATGAVLATAAAAVLLGRRVPAAVCAAAGLATTAVLLAAGYQVPLPVVLAGEAVVVAGCVVVALLPRSPKAPAVAGAIAAGALVPHLALASLGDPVLTEVTLAGLVVASVAAAARAVTAPRPAPRHRWVATVASGYAAAALAGLAVAAGVDADLTGDVTALLVTGAAALALAAAVAVSRTSTGAATALTAVAASVLAFAPLFGVEDPAVPTGALYGLSAVLVGAARLGLLARVATGVQAAGHVLAAAGFALAGIAAATQVPAFAYGTVRLVAPLARPWHGPATSPLGDWRPGTAAGWSVAVAALVVVAVGLAAMRRPERTQLPRVAWAVAPVAVAALALLPVTTAASWPVPVVVLAVAAAACALLASTASRIPVLERAPVTAFAALSLVFGVLALTGSAATRTATVGTLVATTVVAAVLAELTGDRASRRVFAAVAAVGLPATAWAWAAATGSLWVGGLVLCVGGSAVGADALRPHRRRLVPVALGIEVAASWVFLYDAGATVLEAYTLPPAALLCGGGLLALRRRPELSSWRALGPGLLAGAAPTVAVVIVGAAGSTRAFVAVAVAAAVVVAGAVTRRRAPLAVGGGALLLVAGHELAPYAVDALTALPRWVPLAVGGLLLLAVGATYERRLSELRRAQRAYQRLT